MILSESMSFYEILKYIVTIQPFFSIVDQLAIT